jgi:glycosyltransferase involved in cell wall biosynthesis
VITTTPGDDAPGVVRLGVPRLPLAGIACTPALGRAVARALDGYDVVHAHASVVAPAAYAAVAAARRSGTPALVTFHSLLYGAARALAAADAAAGWARPPLLLTGVSAHLAAQLRAALPRARVAVLPNATDVAWWRGAAAAPGGARAEPRAAGEVRAVTAMRLARKKRARDLLRVARAPVRVLVAGEGADRPALARAAASGAPLAVLGWQPREALRALYADADLFVLPSAHESFGIAALEARAAGVPVVGRAGTGLADFVRDGVDGVLAPDADGFVEAVGRLARDPERRAALAAASRAAPPLAFDWPRVVARHEAVYRALLAGDAID